MRDIADSYNGRFVTVLGWGDRDENGNGDYPSILHEIEGSATIRRPKSPDCGLTVGPNQFCIEDGAEDHRFCSGDSGGPVSVKVRM